MIGSAHTFRRLASATGLAALVVAVAIPTAFAMPLVIDGGSSSARGAALQAQTQGLDPAIATAMNSHRNSVTSVDPRPSKQSQTRLDLRSPDTKDAAFAARQRLDLRPPDTRDIVASLHAPAVTPATLVSSHTLSEGSDWGNVLIVLAAIGASFLLVGFGGHKLVTRNHRGTSTGSVRAA